MNLRPLATVVALLLLAGCAVTNAPRVEPAASPTVASATSSAVVAPTRSDTVEASEEPSDDRTDELTGDEFRDAAEQSRRQHSWSEDATRWGLVGRLLSKSSEDGEPVRVKFSAVIRSASYRPDGRRSRNVKLTFDRVAWNPKYTDGGDADVILNPVIKWETLTSGDLLVLINPGDGLHQVPIEKLPAYVSGEHAANKEAGVSDWGTPFFVYFVGDEPVALVEWYVP